MGHSADPPTPRARVTLVLVFAVLGISASAVLVRGMEANPVAIAAWRSAGAALLLSPALLAHRATLSRRDLLSILAAGVALALHFVVWFSSLELTTVLRSTLLVCLSPLWTAALEWAWDGLRPTKRHGLGVGIAVLGASVMVTTQEGTASTPGDALALLGGLLSATYLMVGRTMRARVPLSTYMALVCGVSAAVLFAWAGWRHTPLTGFPPQTWLLLVLAVLGPQLIGHQGLNYAVRFLPAQVIALSLLLEPVGAALLAALILGELPLPTTLLGAAVVLSGVLLATTGAPRP